MQQADATPALDRDVEAVTRVASVQSILKVVCQMTGMGFAAVARVTEGRWLACAVEDGIGFGLPAGGELDIDTTLCKEVRAARAPIAFDHASLDPVYGCHPTPKLYAIESYVSVPIVLADGSYFGNLCAIDPKPANVNNEETLSTFRRFADLIALELDQQRRVEVARRELSDEKADGALREEFIAVLGHDLRNPLSSIAACAHLLKSRRGDPERVADLAERVDANARRMARMIDDMLDLSRGRLGGGLQVAATPVSDLAQAIGDVLDELRAAHPGRRLEATIEIDRPVPGDRGRIQQLVSNLVGNAMTHGAADAPVRVSATTGGGRLVVSVHNEGRPIAADRLADIFGAFNRQPSPDGRQSGLGLGLYICREIAQAHGGDISVTSTEADGTRFTATLPTA